MFILAGGVMLLQALILPQLAKDPLIFFMAWVNLTGLILIVIGLLSLQTYVSVKVFGVIYALFQLIVTIILSVFFMSGLLLIPLVVRRDVLRRWKREPL